MRFRSALLLLVLFLPVVASGQIVVVDFDAAPTDDFETAAYEEDAILTTVDSGHYEIISDAGGAPGDLAFNMDEQELGLSSVTITAQGGLPFDVIRLQVVNPADAAGEVTISAVGGLGGPISAPTVAGNFPLGFSGISALQITQNQPGSFSFDDVELDLLPEASGAASWLAATGLLFALQSRRRC